MTTGTSVPAKTIGQLVAERPERGRIFEHFGIDYCCGGRKLFHDACVQKGLDPSVVFAEIQAMDTEPINGNATDWNSASLTQLADNIESTHHQFTRDELLRIGALIRKVASAHGQRHPELIRLQTTFEAFAEELVSHMDREESVLFPWIRSLESGHLNSHSRHMTLDMPISRMVHEHDDAGEALKVMSELTGGFVPPADACGSYRVMLSSLKELELDLHEHVHKENNILFRRALALEATHT